MDLKIDPEFEQKIPSLTPEEFELLEQNILADGKIRDPLVVWNGYILDGHNRFRILQKHPEIPYTTCETNLPDRYAAIVWICRNQLGRRNLNPDQRKYLIGKQYEAEKSSRGGVRDMVRSRDGKFAANPQNGELRQFQSTSQRIAEETNTSKNYVQRAELFARGIDAAEEVLPGIRDEILSGQIRPTEKAVSEIVRADPEDRRELAELLRQPRGRPTEQSIPKTRATGTAGYEEIPDVEEQEEASREDAAFSNSLEEDVCDPVRPPSPVIREIMAISEGMLHSEGIAAGTLEDMVFELQDALENMIWRWNNIRNTYPEYLKKRTGRKRVRDLASEGIVFFRNIKKGALWNEDQ